MEKPMDMESVDNALASLFAKEKSWLANLSNATSLIYHSLPGLNWVGFYIFDGTELVLGPFQGTLACTRIALSRGVCGKAFSTMVPQNVPNVHLFPAHIACDSASNSELVIPLRINGVAWGVLDIDSPEIDRFNKNDERVLVNAGKHVEKMLERCWQK